MTGSFFSPRLVRPGVGVLLLMLAAAAAADGRWLYLGDTAPGFSWPAAQLSIDLDSLRERGRHHEIWERKVYLLEPGQEWLWQASDGPRERRTLWAIRCSRAAMAVVTRGLAGSFEPRPDKLRYYVPASGSADSAVLEATCGRVGKAATPVAEAAPEALPDDLRAAWRVLERPPPAFIEAADDEDDE